ncbi:MAG TPA: hypothetical protein VMV49_17720 [Candidatus Deferrimicrobium sp.]|nr:hypothetical protein [Candidatus Deferrimicrobium sp.]
MVLHLLVGIGVSRVQPHRVGGTPPHPIDVLERLPPLLQYKGIIFCHVNSIENRYLNCPCAHAPPCANYTPTLCEFFLKTGIIRLIA